MIKIIARLTLALSLFAASPVMSAEHFEPASTYYLYGSCMDLVYKDDTLTTSAHCRAFIQGAMEAHKYLTSYHNQPNHYCLPKTISENEIVGIFLKFVEENPNFIDKSAISTLLYVLDKTFPCSTSQPSN